MRITITIAMFLAATFAMMVQPGDTARAGDCTGYVVGVRPISAYDHARGHGFLAVRTGPGGSHSQSGEVYAGDELSVWERSGNWYYIVCMSGRCMAPFWGPAEPRGWVSSRYVRADGVCP